MVYKKYVKKRGKVFAPYHHDESYRENIMKVTEKMVSKNKVCRYYN